MSKKMKALYPFLKERVGFYNAIVGENPWYPEPFKVLYVSPFSITRVCKKNEVAKKKWGEKEYDFYSFYDGDWDLLEGNHPIDASTVVQSVQEHFYQGVSWENTEIFKNKMSAIKKRGKIDGCYNKEDLLKRYAGMSSLASNIQKNGWRDFFRYRDILDISDCISVSITRNGELLLGGGGFHRLAIARVLDLKAIPVVVLSRHCKWLEARKKISKGDSCHQFLLSHPDLVEFLPSA